MKTRAPLSPSSVTNPQLLSRRKTGDGGTVVNSLTSATAADYTIDDALSGAADTGTLTSLLSWLAGRIKAILGGSLGWKDAPPITLTQTLAHTIAEAGPVTLGHIYAEPSTGKVAYWDGSVLRASDVAEADIGAGIDGAGTAGKVPVWTDADTLGDSRVVVDGSGAHVRIPWVSGDTNPTVGVGSSDPSNDRTAMIGESYSSVGVAGTSTSSNGVSGTSTSGAGVIGSSSSGTGVDGSSTNGVGVSGASTNSYGGTFSTATSGAAGVRGTSSNAGSPAGEFSNSGSGPALKTTGGRLITHTRVINTNLTLSPVHHVIECSTTTAAVTLTLPARAAANDGTEYIIIDVGNNVATAGRAISLNTNIADSFLDGTTSKGLATNRATWHVRAVQDTTGTRRWSLWRINFGA